MLANLAKNNLSGQYSIKIKRSSQMVIAIMHLNPFMQNVKNGLTYLKILLKKSFGT